MMERNIIIGCIAFVGIILLVIDVLVVVEQGVTLGFAFMAAVSILYGYAAFKYVHMLKGNLLMFAFFMALISFIISPFVNDSIMIPALIGIIPVIYLLRAVYKDINNIL